MHSTLIHFIRRKSETEFWPLFSGFLAHCATAGIRCRCNQPRGPRPRRDSRCVPEIAGAHNRATASEFPRVRVAFLPRSPCLRGEGWGEQPRGAKEAMGREPRKKNRQERSGTRISRIQQNEERTTVADDVVVVRDKKMRQEGKEIGGERGEDKSGD